MIVNELTEEKRAKLQTTLMSIKQLKEVDDEIHAYLTLDIWLWHKILKLT